MRITALAGKPAGCEIQGATLMAEENQEGKQKERQAFRVKVSPLNPIKIQFKLAGAPRGVVLATLDDISIAGVGIVLTEPSPLSVGQLVTDGIIHLPEVPPVPFEGTIRWLSDKRAGIQFMKMPERIQRLIFQFVSKREREIVPGH